MPIPTPEQLSQINRFTQVPLTAENTYVFPNMMIDDQVTSYSSVLSPALLHTFQKNAQRGVALLMNHNNRELPVGRSFDAEIRQDTNPENGQPITSLYGSFYFDLGRNTQGGITTDDIGKGIDAGTTFDTSIGFNADHWDCSICGSDIRDWYSCEHVPGEKYVVTKNGMDSVETCLVIVGADGAGELLENSLVYAGACNRATITKTSFSQTDVSDSEIGTKLHVVEDFKNIPLDASIFQYYTKDGSVLYTQTEERTNGSQELRKRSEQKMLLEQLTGMLSKYGISIDSPEALDAALQAFVSVQGQLSTAQTELATAKADLTASALKATEFETKATTAEGLLAAKDTTIGELETANQELTVKAGLGDTYRADLVTKTLEAGVRANGLSFNQELFGKFLGTLSIDEVKTTLASFEKQTSERFAGSRTSEMTGGNANRTGDQPAIAGDFDTEQELRAHVAEEAVKYAKEFNVSISVASKEVMKKLNVRSDT
jgi:hypothetical protein